MAIYIIDCINIVEEQDYLDGNNPVELTQLRQEKRKPLKLFLIKMKSMQKMRGWNPSKGTWKCGSKSCFSLFRYEAIKLSIRKALPYKNR